MHAEQGVHVAEFAECACASCCEVAELLHVEVIDKDTLTTDDAIGSIILPLKPLVCTKEHDGVNVIQGWFPIGLCGFASRAQLEAAHTPHPHPLPPPPRAPVHMRTIVAAPLCWWILAIRSRLLGWYSGRNLAVCSAGVRGLLQLRVRVGRAHVHRLPPAPVPVPLSIHPWAGGRTSGKGYAPLRVAPTRVAPHVQLAIGCVLGCVGP